MSEIASNYRITGKNFAGLAAYNKLESLGFQVLRRGWPDCAAFNPDTGEVRFVEVKPNREGLRAKQEMMRALFANVGMHYEVWNVRSSGFARPEFFVDGHPMGA